MACFLLAGGDSLAGHGYLGEDDQLAMKIGLWARLLSVIAAVFLGWTGAFESDRSAGNLKVGLAIGFIAMSTVGADPIAPSGKGNFLEGWDTDSKD